MRSSSRDDGAGYWRAASGGGRKGRQRVRRKMGKDFVAGEVKSVDAPKTHTMRAEKRHANDGK